MVSSGSDLLLGFLGCLLLHLGWGGDLLCESYLQVGEREIETQLVSRRYIKASQDEKKRPYLLNLLQSGSCSLVFLLVSLGKM